MNGLAQITIDDQPVALKFGMPALRWVSEKMATDDLFNGETWTELGLSHILFAGYRNHCAMNDLPATLKFERFYSYVEDAEEVIIQELAAAVVVFIESKHVKELVGKKKVTTPETKSQLTGTI